MGICAENYQRERWFLFFGEFGGIAAKSERAVGEHRRKELHERTCISFCKKNHTWENRAEFIYKWLRSDKKTRIIS